MDGKNDEADSLRAVTLQNAQDAFSASQGLEDSFRKQTEWLQITLASIGDGVISTDAVGLVTFLNGVAERLTGWSNEKAIGKPLEDVFRIVNEHSRQPMENPAFRALREGTVVGMTNHALLVASDGTMRPIDDCAAPLRGDRDVAIGSVLVFRDISERKRAELELSRLTAESERLRRLYETILTNVPDLICVLDLQRRCTYANAAFLKMWGWNWEDVKGKGFHELGFPVWQAETYEREIEQVITNKRPVRGEVSLLTRVGTRSFDYIFFPVLSGKGEVQVVAGTMRDITDRMQYEEDLRTADRKKDDFIALLAHELRNPLAPLRNGLQVMRLAGDDASAIVRARTMMERQLGHMIRLIDDLLDISRISRNKLELRRSRVTLAEIVESAVETARPAIEAAEHDLTVTLPAQPLYLDADHTRLAQVFSNLLTNAAKYTENGGKIWLRAERKENEAVVSVQDTGIGIPCDALPNIFDMFSQVDRSVERRSGGLGIGLALVKALVEMHDGAVLATSEGRGSTFTVRLPCLAASQSAASPAETSNGMPTAFPPGRRILVVDDNEDSANSLAMMLRLVGNDVSVAYDGLDAVEVAEQFCPEVILMDVGMPRLNGLDATRRIRANSWGESMLIIALTGWGNDGDKMRSKEAGCDGHLVKPVCLEDLEVLLEQFTKSSRSNK